MQRIGRLPEVVTNDFKKLTVFNIRKKHFHYLKWLNSLQCREGVTWKFPMYIVPPLNKPGKMSDGRKETYYKGCFGTFQPL